MIKLPPVDETKLRQSYQCKARADKLRKTVEELERLSVALRREHYNEQYDHCGACNNGTVGEGLTAHQCGYCNNGLLPKGTLSEIKS
jgi:aerobic-type carbon monoxide dehydrogenase small subunit (CoxS/CutS family)